MRVMVLGVSGMLGSAMFRVLSDFPEYEVFGTLRTAAAVGAFAREIRDRIVVGVDVIDDVQLVAVLEKVRPDVVINCVGVIKQLKSASDPLTTLPVNAILPHKLYQLGSLGGFRTIHISTDCVFSGVRGMYRESDQPDAHDLYGVSKHLGELTGAGAVTLRTSIIGHEIASATSLVDWFLNQNKPLKGYRKAIFSGLPTDELADVVGRYVLPTPSLSGLYHVSSEPVSKFDLLMLVGEAYDHHPGIIPHDELVIDRSLDSTRFREITGYRPSAWPQLVSRMRAFYERGL